MFLMTGGSCVWNRMCMMSALLCENGRVLIVKLWFMVLNLCIGLSEGLYIWHEHQWWMFSMTEGYWSSNHHKFSA